MSERITRNNSRNDLSRNDNGESDKDKTSSDKKTGEAGASNHLSKGAGTQGTQKTSAQPQMKSKAGNTGKEADDGGIAEPGSGGNSFAEMFLGAPKTDLAKKFEQEERVAADQPNASTKKPIGPKKTFKLDLTKLADASNKQPAEERTIKVSARNRAPDSLGSTSSSHSGAALPVQARKLPNPTSPRGVGGWMPASPRSTPTTSARTPGALPASTVAAPGLTTTLSTPLTATVTTTTLNTSTLTTTTTSATGPAVTTTIASDTKNRKIDPQKSQQSGAIPASLLTASAVEAINLALAGEVVSGDQLAEILLCVQSAGYTAPMTSALVDTILRSGMTISDFPDPGNPGEKIKINVIELVSLPFVQKHIDTKEMKRMRKQVIKEYKNLIQDLSPKLREMSAKDLRKNKVFSKLMQSLISDFLENYIGKELKLSTSNFPSEFKKLLQGIDERVLQWAKVKGNDDSKLLFEARKSAIAAYMATRSITPIWTMAVQKDPERGDYHLQLLLSYINTLLTTQLDEFYFDVMSSAKNQDEAQARLLKAHAKASAIVLEDNQRRKKIDDATKEKKSKEKRNTSSFFLPLVSPRKEVSPRDTASSPRRTEQEVEKQNPRRAAQLERNRRIEVDALMSRAGRSAFSKRFFGHLKETVISLNVEDYRQFKRNPAAFALDLLNQYVFDHVSGQDFDAGDLVTLKSRLEDLVQRDKNSQLSQVEPTLPESVPLPATTAILSSTLADSASRAAISVVPTSEREATPVSAHADVSADNQSTASEESMPGDATEARSDEGTSSTSQ